MDKSCLDGKRFFIFIIYLRALAACLITNSHYEGIYPFPEIANGGLLGDILFFAVSGYCLWTPEKNVSFGTWYAKRLQRCFLPVWVITALFALTGTLEVTKENFRYLFLYPTNYHFVSSITILYLPFFLCMKFFNRSLLQISVSLWGVYLLIYILFYDKSVYHIDTVREPMILFLFLQNMFLGAYFKENVDHYIHSFSQLQIPLLFILAILYGGSKYCFSRYGSLSNIQFINQLLIFALVFILFRFFMGLEQKLPRKSAVLCPINILATLTLEIYLVQFPIIAFFQNHTTFPINWLLCSISILIAAFILHYFCAFIVRSCLRLSELFRKRFGY